MPRFIIIIFLFLLLIVQVARGQSVYAPVDARYYHLLERYEVLQGEISSGWFNGIRPFTRAGIATYFKEYPDSLPALNGVDRFNISYMRADNFDYEAYEAAKSAKPVLKNFYQNKPFLYDYESPEFGLYINPVLNLTVGQEQGEQGIGNIWQNTRGIELRGHINKKIGFYSYLTENQIRTLGFISAYARRDGTFPGAGMSKFFKDDTTAYDFFIARGYITFPIAGLVQMQFGNDVNMIGHGYRSLAISDFAKDNLFLKANLKVWKLNYMLLWSWYEALPSKTQRNDQRTKYGAFHHLSANLGKKLTIGVFEQVIFARGDSVLGGGNFDINYLNPVIFWRAVEQGIGRSEDNILIGFDFRAILAKGLTLYGQANFDEFTLSALRESRGSSVNKYGLQGGVKWMNAFTVKNLDIGGEVNMVRPYTYQHYNFGRNNTHFGTAIAHPTGANFAEIQGRLTWQPLNRLTFMGRVIMSNYGTDSAGINFGGDLNKDYRFPYRSEGNVIGQGVANNLLLGELITSYMVAHNVFFDLRVGMRNNESPSHIRQYNGMWIQAGFRINTRLQEFDF